MEQFERAQQLDALWQEQSLEKQKAERKPLRQWKQGDFWKCKECEGELPEARMQAGHDTCVPCQEELDAEAALRERRGF